MGDENYVDTFSVNTQISVNIQWENDAKDEKHQKQREQFEEFIQFLAENMNQDLGKILVSSYEEAVRQESGMDIFNNEKKIEVT